MSVESALVAPPEGGVVEHSLLNLVEWLSLAIEAIGALVIAIGIFIAAVHFFRCQLANRPAEFVHTRLTLARYLALALEFQLGADILSTAIAPTWDQIGQLAAIAVIRTGLNFFLMREMREAEEISQRNGAAKPQGETP